MIHGHSLPNRTPVGAYALAAMLLATVALVPADDEKDRAQALYDYYEKACIEKGWRKVVVKVGDRDRQLMWRGPEGAWKHGAVIAMHGGGGTYSNFGAGLPLGEPMVEFGSLAVEKGFAVFSPDSTDGGATDAEGRSCGKRWDCVAVDGRENIDLPFIETVITQTIPELRPPNSAKHVFITGISNGGFMTVLAATHFPEKITAFAVVSAGDPYGTTMDMGTHPPRERQKAPGVFRDNETHRQVNEERAAVADAYPNEKAWPDRPGARKPPFKQFHHEGDGACDISCMKKAQRQLVAHGYPDDGAFIIGNIGRRSVWKHFWQKQYNEPLIEFFMKCVKKN
ncbi:MAG: hypothetical protein AB1696_04290 [Planctomycetota bacterium]